MLASLAALQLLLVAQAPAAGAPAWVEPIGAQPAATPPAAEAPPTPPTSPAPPTPPRPGVPAATAPEPPRPRLPSLLGAEPLGGASAVFGWAGWSSLGAAYAIGVSPEDDLGFFVDHDWAKSELRLGALYRRPFATLGPWDVAVRVSAAYYTNFGATYVYSDNHSDRGLSLAPALVLSARAGGGLFAVSAEAPMTVTWKYASGFLFSPRASASYEMPLYSQLTVGARFGAGYRAGAGDAPLSEGRGELQFLVLVGYRLL